MSKTAKPALLAGGNPQIAKAYGDAWVKQPANCPVDSKGLHGVMQFTWPLRYFRSISSSSV